jgi:DnaD/phage-associated family protein
MTSDLITLETKFRENSVPVSTKNLEIIEKKYGLAVCTKALREALKQGHPEFRYVAGILTNWEAEGLPADRAGPPRSRH